MCGPFGTQFEPCLRHCGWMKPMWFGSFQIVHSETFGSGCAAGFAADVVVPGEPPELPPEPPLEPPLLRRLFGKAEPLESTGWKLALPLLKIEPSRSESPECVCSGGGATPYFG